ncbi:MAG: ABC transporter permease subunit [Candidatus Lokiarchaeota archaeon]|nr:ABC transporter permease subunit [Candidatus Lokiarchaeota archaeon]
MKEDSTNKNSVKKDIIKSMQSFKNNFFRLLKQIKKEFRLLKTDPWNLVIAILIPPGIILLFSFMNAESGTPTALDVVVVSNDSNTFINPNNFTEQSLDNYSKPYLDAVNKSIYLNLIEFYNASEYPYGMEEAREKLRWGEIKCIIVIPVDFTEFLELGLPGQLQCIPDTSDFQNLQKSLNSVYDSIKIFTRDNNLTPQFYLEGYEEFAIPPDFNFKFNSTAVLILPLMIFGIANVLTILVIVKEKPIARLLLTPVKRAEILISKYITYGSVLLIQNIAMIIASLAGGLYVKGSMIDLFGALYILGYVGMSMGLFISAISKSKTEANQLFFAFFIVIILLSGLFVPLDSMPIYLQVFAAILPLTHGDPMISAIISKGKSLFGYNFFVLLVVSLVLNIITFIVFLRRRYEV